MNRTLSTSLLAAALGAVIISTACNSGSSNPASSGQPASAVVSAARELDPSSATSTEESDHESVSYFESVFNQLRQVPALAPLFTQYSVPMPAQYNDDDHQVSGTVSMLSQVRITIQNGQVTITNRQNGGVIYAAPLSDVSSGTFNSQNMPGGTTTTPPPATCTAFTYSTWGTCANGLQTRTVQTSSPSGCTGGSPVLSQTCTSTPPPPATCSAFTYSAFGACQSNGTQTRTVATSSPSGCTGGTPVLSQSCTYVPPVTTCSSFTYSTWGACQSNGTQTRTVATSSPSGCTGGTPVLSQSCTYTAPNPVTSANIVSSCTGCHGLTSNTTVFKSGGYTVSGRSSAQWLSTVNNMVGLGSSLAPGTTAQNYADYLANVP